VAQGSATLLPEALHGGGCQYQDSNPAQVHTSVNIYEACMAFRLGAVENAV
jgi:hypothetical protein